MADYEEKRGFFNRQDEITWYIYDAVEGERFELRDVGCPLKTVSFVFDCENVSSSIFVTYFFHNILL